MKKKMILFLLMSGLLSAQQPENNEQSAGLTAAQKEAVAQVINDMEFFGNFQLRAIWHGSNTTADRMNTHSVVNSLVPDGENRQYTDFSARRLRLGVKGKVNKQWEYKFELKGESMITGSSGIQEATVGYIFGDPMRIRLGSQKVPFTRENLTSSSMLLTMERSAIVGKTGYEYDTGLALDGRLWEKKIGYGVGVFNGNGGFADGVNGTGNVNGQPNITTMGAARVAVDPLGEYKDGKAYFSDKLLVSLGLGSYYQQTSAENTKVSPYSTASHGVIGGTVDLAFNFSIINVEAAYVDVQAKSQPNRVSGYYGQVAVFAMPKFLQVWVRYENYHDSAKDMVAQTNGTADLSDVKYITPGVNLYFVGEHKVKLQAAYHMGLNKGKSKYSGDYEDLKQKDDWGGITAQIAF